MALKVSDLKGTTLLLMHLTSETKATEVSTCIIFNSLYVREPYRRLDSQSQSIMAKSLGTYTNLSVATPPIEFKYMMKLHIVAHF